MVVGVAGGGGSRRSRLAAVLMMILPISLCLTPPRMYTQPPSLDREPIPHPPAFDLVLCLPLFSWHLTYSNLPLFPSSQFVSQPIPNGLDRIREVVPDPSAHAFAPP